MFFNSIKVLLYIPNIIGYIRILFLIYFQKYDNYLYYILSYLLDGVDGFLARKFNQCSIFGYYLDMLIDRISSGYILTLCSYINPLFIIFLINEEISHLIVLIDCYINNEHQKETKENYLISNLYLSSKYIMFLSIVGSEAFAINFIYKIIDNNLLNITLFLIFMFRQIACFQRMLTSTKRLFSKLKVS